MNTRFIKEVDKFYRNEKKKLVAMEDIDSAFFRETIKNSLTQVDICEIVDSALLHHDSLGTPELIESLDSILETKKNISLCNFKDKDPNSVHSDEYDGPSEDEGCPDSCDPSSTVSLSFIKD